MPALRPAVAATLAAALLLVFIQRFILVDLFFQRDGVALLLAVVEAIAIIGAGRLLLRERSDLVKAFIVGYPLFGTACFIAGLIRVSVWTLTPLVILFAIVGVFGLIRERETEVATPPPTWSVIAVALVFLCGFVAAQAPPVTLDELAYHLAIPRTWALEGRSIELPLISHSYFPLGIESADLPALVLLDRNGAITSHFLHFFAALATTVLLLRRSRSWLVTAAIVTTPAIALTAGWSLVDWPLLGICVVLAEGVDKDNRREITAAVAAGLLTKYTFIPFALIAIAARKRWSRELLVGAAVGSIFFLRNFVLTGNPVAPFLSAGAPHVSGYRELNLWSYLFDGRFIDETLGASLIAICFAAGGLVAWLFLAAAALLFLLAPSSRILIPFLAVPATSAKPGRVLQGLVAIAISIQLFLIGYYVHRTRPFSLLAGELSDEEYVVQQRPSVALVNWLNGMLPEDSRTLVIGLNESFWFTRRARVGGNFDGPLISRYLAMPTADALRERLDKDGITHVAIVNVAAPTRIASKSEERQTRLTPAAQKTLTMMLDRYATSVANLGDQAALFALR